MLGKESSEFVEIEPAVSIGGRGGYEHGRFMSEWNGRCGISLRTSVLVVKSFDVLLQLKRGL